MKVKLKTTFERYGQYITGHIQDPEMYENVKSGRNKWEDTVYPRITHIRLPKEVFERLLELDRGQKLLINDFKSNNSAVISNNAIEEMAKDVAHSISWDDDVIPTVDCLGTAAALYGIGYRKQSEGEWLVEKFKNGDMFINCSACNSVIDCIYLNIDENEFDFCPYCGAKMKGGAEK